MTRFVFFLALSLLPWSSAAVGGATPEDPRNLGVATAEEISSRRYVLSYGADITLDDVESVVGLLDAKVERPLTCTRGVVISTEGETFFDKNDVAFSGFSLLPIANAHPHQAEIEERELGSRNIFGRHSKPRVRTKVGRQRTPREHNKPKPPNGQSRCNCDRLRDVYENNALAQEEVTALKGAIKANIDLDSGSYAGSTTDSIGELLRLVFHDVAAFDANNRDSSDLSGLNGCVDLNFPSNAGLQSAIDFLTRLRTDSGIAISFADLFVLGAIAAVEAAGGPSIAFQYGRVDVPCGRCEHNFFPDPESPAAQTTAELDTSMRDRLGLTRREITALLGSHTVGRLEVVNSGYSGGWIPPEERSTFSNLYYFVMIERPWVKTTKEIDGKILTEWRSPKIEIDAMMLNIDAILGFEIEDCNVFGEDPENFLGTGGLDGNLADFVPADIVNCTRRNDEYGTAVADFAADNDVWLDEYAMAFTKMVETTVPCGQLRVPTT